jgi:hypothetical protein
MKKLFLSVSVLGLLGVSCAKNKCAECHYDAPSGEVELKNLEALGTYTDSLGATYVVHCGEH